MAIGIDSGGTRMKTALVDAAGEVLRFHEAATPNEREPLIETVTRAVEALTIDSGRHANATRADPCPIGLCAPGLTAPGASSIHWMGGRMTALVGLDWAAALDRPVEVINDAHAATLGEAWSGAGRKASHLVMLTLGTGVGGGVMVDGRILRGAIGRAGHLGHISLDPEGSLDIVNTPGSLENAVGDHTVRQRTGGRFDSTQALAEAVAAGDEHAQPAWDRMVRRLAAGRVSLVNAFDPELIILGGGVAQAGDTLLAPLERQFRAWEWQPGGQRVELCPATLGPWAGAIGAAREAMRAGVNEVRSEP
jgi:glucokinase